MLKKILTKSLKFLKLFFLTIMGAILLIVIIAQFTSHKYRNFDNGGGKTYFQANRNKFEEILRKFDKDKRITEIHIKTTGFFHKSSGLVLLNDFRVNDGEIESIGSGLKTRFTNSDELYNYYGLKKEEVQWYLDKLKAIDCSSIEKDEMWVKGDVKSKFVKFRRAFWGGDDFGLIFNSQNKMPEKREIERDWGKFERLEDNWFVYIQR